MHCLEEVVHAARDRIGLRKHIEELVSCCEAAKHLWQDYLNHPGPAGDPYSIVSWIGPVRSRQLHALSLQACGIMRIACTEAGAKAVGSLSLEEPLIVQPYRMLKPGETGVEAAQQAVETLDLRIADLHRLAMGIGE
jgi:hypothetical protein